MRAQNLIYAVLLILVVMVAGCTEPAGNTEPVVAPENSESAVAAVEAPVDEPTDSPPELSAPTPLPPTEPPPTDPHPPTATLPPTEPPPTMTPETETAATDTENPPLAVEVTSGVQFGSTEHHVVDVYRPEMDEAALPTLVMVMELGGSMTEMAVPAEYFAERGYAVVVPQIGGGVHTLDRHFPLFEENVLCSLAWVHTNAAEYGFNSEQVVLMGYYLGGTEAAWAGTVDDPAAYLADCPHPLPEGDLVEGVIAIGTIFDYADYSSDFFDRYFGSATNPVQAKREASPVTWVDAGDPPFLLIHGLNDRWIEPAESEEFAAVLAAAGVPVELALPASLPHDAHKTHTNITEPVLAFLADLFGD